MRPHPAHDRADDRSDDRDRGSYALITLVLATVLLMLAGMVYDGGAKLRAAQQANNLAEEAARAGAGQINLDRAYTAGEYVIGQDAAVRAARAYLAGIGLTGSVTPMGTHQIQVTVTITKPTALLSLIGVGSMSVTRTATADLLFGIEGPGR